MAADDRQVCLPHLLRELVKVDERNDAAEWAAFSKALKRLVRDGIRLRQRPDFTPDRYRSRIRLIHRWLVALAEMAYADPDAARLADRLQRFRDFYFTFLDKPHVPPDNNHAERQVRPAVVQRKMILCNARPTRTIAAVLRELVLTGELQPLTRPAVADNRSVTLDRAAAKRASQAPVDTYCAWLSRGGWCSRSPPAQHVSPSGRPPVLAGWC